MPPQLRLNVPKPTILSAFSVLSESISTVGALLALILGYGAISEERDKKTLRVLLSYPIYRDSVINAKFISRFISNMHRFDIHFDNIGRDNYISPENYTYHKRNN